MIGITCLKLSCEQAIYGDYRHQGQHPEMLSYQELTATSLILWENVDRIVQFWFKPSTNVLCGSFESFTFAGYECFQSLGKLGNCYDLMWSYFVSNVMKKLYICFYFTSLYDIMSVTYDKFSFSLSPTWSHSHSMVSMLVELLQHEAG